MATYRPVKTYQRLWRRKIYKRRATLPAHIVDCRECGLRNHIPWLSQGQEAACSRCGHELVQVESNPYIAPLAYTTTTLILLAIVYSQMFLTIEMPGVYSRLTLPGMMKILIVQDWGFLAEVMLSLFSARRCCFCCWRFMCIWRWRGSFYAVSALRHPHPGALAQLDDD